MLGASCAGEGRPKPLVWQRGFPENEKNNIFELNLNKDDEVIKKCNISQKVRFLVKIKTQTSLQLHLFSREPRSTANNGPTHRHTCAWSLDFLAGAEKVFLEKDMVKKTLG